MLRKEFIQLVEHAVDAGFDRGINLFLENLEESIGKEAIYEEVGGMDATVNALLEEELKLEPMTQAMLEAEYADETATDTNELNENNEEYNEDALDAALDELEKGGYTD